MALGKFVLLATFATCCLAVTGFESSSRQEKFVEGGDWAWEALKTLGITDDNKTAVSPPAFSTEDFGEEVESPSLSSRQRKNGDLRNLVKQIREQDEQSSNNDQLQSSAIISVMPNILRIIIFASFTLLLVNI